MTDRHHNRATHSRRNFQSNENSKSKLPIHAIDSSEFQTFDASCHRIYSIATRFVDARNFNLCRLRRQCEFFIINYSHARFCETTWRNDGRREWLALTFITLGGINATENRKREKKGSRFPSFKQYKKKNYLWKKKTINRDVRKIDDPLPVLIRPLFIHTHVLYMYYTYAAEI